MKLIKPESFNRLFCGTGIFHDARKQEKPHTIPGWENDPFHGENETLQKSPHIVNAHVAGWGFLRSNGYFGKK